MSLFIAKDQTRGNTRIEWHRIQRMGKLIAVCRNAILQFLKQRTCQGPRSSFESGVGGGGGGGDPPLLKCSWTEGVVDFKNGLPCADSIFFNTVTTHQAFFNSLTNEKGVSNKQSATMHSSTIICPCFIYFKSLSVLSLRVSRSFL